MTKEILRKENIREDLLKVIRERNDIQWEWRLSYIVPLATLALIFWFAWPMPWLGLVVFFPSVYHIFRLVQKLRMSHAHKKELMSQFERGDLSISEEVLSHISEETVYEPHQGHRRAHTTKLVHIFYFQSGASWRHHPVEKHYAWSKLYDLSPEGLENTSVAGDAFYYVRLQSDGEIGYVYNKKLFEYMEN